MTIHLDAAGRNLRTLFLAVAFLATGCDFKRTSLMRAPRAGAASLRAKAADLAGRSVLVVGHKAGACDVYPHDPIRGQPERPVPAADLLADPELAPFDAAELDVHVAPDGFAYVSHEAEDLAKLREVLAQRGIDPERFIQRSGLAESISAYFEKHPGGQLFIELKAGRPRDPGTTDGDRRLAKAVHAHLDQVRQRLPDAALSRITFTSFRVGALQALHDDAGAAFPGLKYALILGTDQTLFLLFSDLPVIKDQLAELSKPEARFVSEVWFSLASMGTPETTLRQVRAAGVERLFSDAYLEKPDELKAGLGRLSSQGFTMTGLVFDAVADPAQVKGKNCPP